jgi:DNA-directed RNA polymerase subunit RPC12/RpoP
MIANTKCQHCGNEFEIDGMNRTEFCPHCGKETLIVGQVAAPAPAYTAATFSAASTLKQIRQQTCYERVFRKSFDESEDLLAKLDYSVAPHFSAGSSNSN